MTVQELIDILSSFDPEAPVIGAFQPSYPLFGDIQAVNLDDSVEGHNYEAPDPDPDDLLADGCAVCGNDISDTAHAPGAGSGQVVIAIGEGGGYGKREWFY